MMNSTVNGDRLNAAIAQVLGVEVAPLDEDRYAHYLIDPKDPPKVDITPLQEWAKTQHYGKLELSVATRECELITSWYSGRDSSVGEISLSLGAPITAVYLFDHPDGPEWEGYQRTLLLESPLFPSMFWAVDVAPSLECRLLKRTHWDWADDESIEQIFSVAGEGTLCTT